MVQAGDCRCAAFQKVGDAVPGRRRQNACELGLAAGSGCTLPTARSDPFVKGAAPGCGGSDREFEELAQEPMRAVSGLPRPMQTFGAENRSLPLPVSESMLYEYYSVRLELVRLDQDLCR